MLAHRKFAIRQDVILFIGALLTPSYAQLGDCIANKHGVCTQHDIVPVPGEALLQRHSKREHTDTVTDKTNKRVKSWDDHEYGDEAEAEYENEAAAEYENEAESGNEYDPDKDTAMNEHVMIASAVGGKLPPGAKELFDEKLCKAKPKSTEKKSESADNSSKSNSSSNSSQHQSNDASENHESNNSNNAMEDTYSRNDNSDGTHHANGNANNANGNANNANGNANNEDHVHQMGNMKKDAHKEFPSHSGANAVNDEASSSGYSSDRASSLNSRTSNSANMDHPDDDEEEDILGDDNDPPSKNNAADNADEASNANTKSSTHDESTDNSEDNHAANNMAPFENQGHGLAHREVHTMNSETQHASSVHHSSPKTDALARTSRKRTSSEVSRQAHHTHSKAAKPRKPVKSLLQFLERHASIRSLKPKKVSKKHAKAKKLDPAPPFSRSFLDELGPQSPGMDAAISESGFKKVAGLKNEEEMRVYIRRVASHCQMKVTDEGGLNGLAAWFGGEESDEPGSLDKLKESLFGALLAASKDHWVTVKNSTNVTGSTAPLDLIGYVQVRSLRKAKEMVKFVKRMVESMGIKIIDKGGFEGLMHYYSEPDDSESFQRLLSEIKKAAYLHTWAELE